MKKHSFIKFLALSLALLCTCLLVVSCAKGAEDTVMNEVAPMSPTEGEAGLGNLNVTIDFSQASERKVIKKFNISCETKNFEGALDSLNTLIAEYNGYVESANTQNKSMNNSSDHYTRSATLTVRIPAEQADAFVASVGDLLHITENNSSAEDVSETYYSVEARLEELKTERDSLLQIMESINHQKDYNFWLTVNQRLSEVTQQIAVYQGQINRFDGQIAYSTVQLSLREVLNYSAINQNNTFGKRLGTAFVNGWNDFVVFCQGFAIWFAQALPMLVLLGVIATGAILIVRRTRQKKREKIAAERRKQNSETE